MRLSKAEINNFKTSIFSLDKEAKLYLFGSRTDDQKRGGDIDLLIISKSINREQIRKIRLNFYDEFGEQQIDILQDDGRLKEPFKKLIYAKAIQL